MDLSSCALGEKKRMHLQVLETQSVDDGNPQASMKPDNISQLTAERSSVSEHIKATNGDCSVQGSISKTRARLGSQVVTEPDVGSEAPPLPLDDETDVEEEADDVEFPEAVVMVGKTNWRCVTCMVHFPRTASIDSHINDHHQLQQEDPSIPPVEAVRRGRRRDRGLTISVKGRNSTMALRNPFPELEQKSLRLLLRPVQKVKQGRAGGNKNLFDKNTKNVQGRGKGLRGGRHGRGRGRGGGGRGRGKAFTKARTNEDAETDASHPPLFNQTTPKRKEGIGSEADEVFEGAPSITSNKKPRYEENADLLSTNSSEILPEAPASPEPTSHGAAKEMIQEKYVVVMEKAGTTECPTESEAHLDIDPPSPIETPSLQADTLLPPATPIMPDIHGPPETPTPLDNENSLHMPEAARQSDTSYRTAETPGAVDSQELVRPDQFLSPGTPGILSVLASESNNKIQDTEDNSVGEGSGFHSSGVFGMDKATNTECRTCGMAFNSPCELRSHKVEMMKYAVVSCLDCGDKFHGLHQLNIHVFTVHEKLAKRFCFFCKTDCLNDFELAEHLLEHTSNEPNQDNTGGINIVKHTCKTCGTEMVGNISVLMNHYHTAHNQYICMECLEIFTDSAVYESHKILHTSAIGDTHAVYDKDEVLHGASSVSGPVVYACPVNDCFEICRDKAALMDHISWHEDRDLDDEQLNFLYCHLCDGQFYHKVALDRHLSEIHNEPNLRPFVCELCKEDFSHSLDLKRHNNHYHSGIKRYGCAYCDERFELGSLHRQHVASEHDVPATVLHM